MSRRDWLARRRQAKGFSQASLAARIGADRITISRWERGNQSIYPRWRPALADALDLSVEELDELINPGAPDEPRRASSVTEDRDVGLRYNASIPATLDAVEVLGTMDRRALLKSAVFAATASAIPSRDWLLATIDAAEAPTQRISSSQVDAIRRTFAAFQELDVFRGGGHARYQLVDYLNTTVAPLLRSNDPTTATGQALYEAGAEQLYLLGWMAFDDGAHTVAQRYLIQALRLAQEAARPELGAHIHAGLADQANLTGHPDQALQLARAGRAGLTHGRSTACLADLWALQARAEASLGNRPAVIRSITQSERIAERIRPDEEPEWARFIAGAYLHGEYANAFTDLGQSDEATRYATLSATEARQQGRARRGALAYAAQARAALNEHDLDVATAAATSTLQLAATVTSSRCVDAVADLRTRLQPHNDSPRVRDFLELADALGS